MQVLKKHFKQHFTLISIGLLLYSNLAMAATDLSEQESLLRTRVKNYEQNANHENHLPPIDKSLDFHGVFYGFLPCNNCNGIKSTLSLKQKNNYLLVTQPAKESSRETYEKGKYDWNEVTRTVVLTPRDESKPRQYQIKDEGTLVLMNSDGTPMPEKQSDSYTLRRSDTVKAREVHIH